MTSYWTPWRLGIPLGTELGRSKKATTWIVVLAVLYRYRMMWIYIWIYIYIIIYIVYTVDINMLHVIVCILYIWHSCRRPDFIFADLLRCLNVSSPQMKFCFGLLRAVTWLWDCAGTGGNFVLRQSTQKKDVTGRISYVRNRKIMENIRIHQANIVRY